MKIPCCPKCKKAGLKWLGGKELSSSTNEEEYVAYWTTRWCPRCRERVTPVYKDTKGGRC